MELNKRNDKFILKRAKSDTQFPLWESILTHTRTALGIKVAEAIVALFAAGAVFQITFTTLRQHAFGDHRCAYLFVARIR